MKTTDSVNAQSTSEYQRFKDFARAIIAVPKEEIDKAEKQLPPQKVGAKRIPKPDSV